MGKRRAYIRFDVSTERHPDMFCVVDASDAALVFDGGAGWYVCDTGSNLYVVRNISGRGIQYIHRHIMGEPVGSLIDHVSGDTLDNRRSNLRFANKKINGRNCKLSKANTSGHVGVRVRNGGRFNARIKVNSKDISLGNFDTLEEAIAARKKAEVEFGFHRNHGRR